MNKIKFINSVSEEQFKHFQIQKLINQIKSIDFALGAAFEYDYERYLHQSNN